MTKIPLSRPDITQKERKAVLGVLKTPYLAMGPRLKEFEEKFANYIGVKYAIAVNSGTAGLHLLIRAFGIGKSDEVITTPFSFIASANCILYENAKPIFVDIDPNTLTIDSNKIERAITRKTKAILPVDIFGHPANWGEILKIAKKYRLTVIEDSCEALGAQYRERMCGVFGDAAVFAFYPNKQITTGEGGMIVTNNKKIADLCRSMANQGRRIKNGKWLEHIRLGYNYRMSDINAALGINQLSRINEIIKKRFRVAKTYNQYLLKISEVNVPYVDSLVKIPWFVYVIRLSKVYSRRDRDQIIRKMGAAGIQCGNYFQCIHLQPFYRRLFGYRRGSFPVAESISDQTLALPFYNNLTKKETEYIIKSIKRCL